jgi:hypothetical protein
MSTDNSRSTRPAFTAGTVERVLDEFRGDHAAVDDLFHVHVGEQEPASLDVETVEDALAAVNSAVCLAVRRATDRTEYLYCQRGDDGPEWYSITSMQTRQYGPTALYQHNVTDRLDAYGVDVVRTDSTPFGTVELPPHTLDLEEDGVRLDA